MPRLRRVSLPPPVLVGWWAVTDRHGNRVEVRRVDGREVFIVTRDGRLVGRHLGDGRTDPTTIEELVAVGVDIASLA